MVMQQTALAGGFPSDVRAKRHVPQTHNKLQGKSQRTVRWTAPTECQWELGTYLSSVLGKSPPLRHNNSPGVGFSDVPKEVRKHNPPIEAPIPLQVRETHELLCLRRF